MDGLLRANTLLNYKGLSMDKRNRIGNEPSNRQSIAWTRNIDLSGKAGRLLFVAVFGLSLLLAVPIVGGAGEAVDERLAFSLGNAWRLDLFPAEGIYDPYIADPLRPGFSLMQMDIMDSDIPDAGESRYSFMLGGKYGFFKFRHSDLPDMAVQVDIYGAFLGQFDLENSTDNIGWDGFYGVMFTWTGGDGLSLKLAMQHDSSHVGDEYAERTGRLRINYTREEIAFGLSYRFPEYFRVYSEAGYGHNLRNTELQRPWRVKGGIEFEAPDRFFNGRLGYYAAVDLSSTEEMDWETDVTVQTGVVLPMRRFSHTVRIGPIYRNGPSVIGEFFQHKEEWWGMGMWIDI